MTQTQFIKDRKYTRDSVAEQIGRPPENRGGNWNTGYATWNGECFVFCNIGTAGRTGHDYPNRWDGPELVWYGKGPSHRDEPLMRQMINGQIPVHMFWRDNDRKPFTYAGLARAVEVDGSSPVRVRWRF